MNYEIKNTSQLQYIELTPYVSAPIYADLTKMHTHLLISLLRRTHATCTVCDGPCEVVTGSQQANLNNWINRLREELKTREHIPNKKQSQEARIQRKKSGISRKHNK